MLIFAFILICIIFVDIQSAGKNEFYNDYCSPKQTTSINGIFVILVFFSHATQYLKLNGPLNTPYATFKGYIGQLIVVTFLFYSGYGIMESIKKKGIDYVKSIPWKRFFRIWYHFAIAVGLYVVWCLAFNKDYPISRYLLTFTGWESIGNSNWYMLSMFVLYIAVFIAFIIFRKSNLAAIALTAVLAFSFILFERKMNMPGYYYNTLMCFIVGMLFSLVKPYFDKIFLKNDVIWVIGMGAVCGLFIFFGTKRNISVIYYTLWAILFAVLVLFVTMKAKIQNSILDWFGHHVFSIYILQRLPMSTLQQFKFNETRPFAFLIISFVSTIVIAIIFDAAMEKIDSLIYNRKKVKRVPTKQNNAINAQPSTTEIKA